MRKPLTVAQIPTESDAKVQLVGHVQVYSVINQFLLKLMRITPSLLATICFLTYACTDNTPEAIDYGPPEHSVSIGIDKDTLKLSQLFNSVEKIDLTGCGIRHIGSVIEAGGCYIVKGVFFETSAGIKSEVARFSKDGNFLGHLVISGRSAEEMINVQAVKLNPFTGGIDILGNNGTDFYSYDTSTWKITGKAKVPGGEITSVADFIAIDKNKYLFYKNLSCSRGPEYKLYLYDFDAKKIIDNFIPMDKKKSELLYVSQRNNLFREGEAVFFAEAFDKHVYKLLDGHFGVEVEEKKSNYSIPDDFPYHSYGDDLVRFTGYCKSGGFVWLRRNYVLFHNQLLSTFKYNDDTLLNIVNLNEDTSHSYAYISDDIFTLRTVSIADGAIVFVSSDSNNCYAFMDSSSIGDPHVKEPFSLLCFK